MEHNNPYAAPATQPSYNFPNEFSPAVQKKAEAIAKDASQYLIAIALCLLCTGLGSIIIGPWYLVRLLQWNALAKQEPRLLAPNSPPKSLPQQFQSAKWKLMVGIGFGALMLVLVAAYVALLSLAGM